MKKKYTFMALNDIYTTPSVDSVKKTSEYKKGMPGGCNCYLSRLRVLKKQTTKQLIFNKKKCIVTFIL